MNYQSYKRLFFRLFVLVLPLVALSSCASDDSLQKLQTVSQDAMTYVDAATADRELISPASQELLVGQQLQRYFSPWADQERLLSNTAISQVEEEAIQRFRYHPGWGENYHPHTSIWIESIIKNMHLTEAAQQPRKAITTNGMALRALPTNEPSFTNFTDAGEGYPFDNLQLSWLSAGLPILILQTSQDKAWYLILTQHTVGWVTAQNVATVDAHFIRHWQKQKYIVTWQDNLPLVDHSQHFYYGSRIGTLYPLVGKDKHHWQVAVVAMDSQRRAVSKVALLPKTQGSIFPISITSRNIAHMTQAMLGTPYGWGGLYGYRDCSLTIADLFTPFGIGLPRNSSQQAKAGKYISLENLSNVDKLKQLKQHGIPWLTLINLPGHVMLYIGDHNGSPYVFQDVWGIHTKWNKKGRIVIGKTVNIPLDFDEHYINTNSWLNRVESITFLDTLPSVIPK